MLVAGLNRVRQERFLLNPAEEELTVSESASSPYGYKWEVPLTWISSTNPNQVNQKRNPQHFLHDSLFNSRKLLLFSELFKQIWIS
jgi:hypothetical protein